MGDVLAGRRRVLHQSSITFLGPVQRPGLGCWSASRPTAVTPGAAGDARAGHGQRRHLAVLLQRQGVDHRGSVQLQLRLRGVGSASQAGRLAKHQRREFVRIPRRHAVLPDDRRRQDLGAAEDDLHETSLTGTIGNQIAVLPDGTLVDIFDYLQGSGNNVPGFEIKVQRSTDHGATWSEPIEVAPERAVRVFDPETGVSVRAGGGLPDIAVDRNPAERRATETSTPSGETASAAARTSRAQHHRLHRVHRRRAHLVAAVPDRPVAR